MGAMDLAGREGVLYVQKQDTRKKICCCLAKIYHAREEYAHDMLFTDNYQSRYRSFTSHIECKGLKINNSTFTDPEKIMNSFENYFKELDTLSQPPLLLEAESDILDLEHSSFMNCENIVDANIELDEVEGALRTLKLGESTVADRHHATFRSFFHFPLSIFHFPPGLTRPCQGTCT